MYIKSVAEHGRSKLDQNIGVQSLSSLSSSAIELFVTSFETGVEILAVVSCQNNRGFLGVSALRSFCSTSHEVLEVDKTMPEQSCT